MSSSSNQSSAVPPFVPPTTPKHDHVFNTDLLIRDEDLVHAREKFSDILHVLDHPELRAAFNKYEQDANAARDKVRSLGFAAVVTMTIALLALATNQIWPHTSWTRWVAVAIEVAGMVSAIAAIGGLGLGPWKRNWLESRFMTERMRQWHFQLMVRRGHDVEISCHGPAAVAKFKEKRQRWFADFLKAHEDDIDSHLSRLIRKPREFNLWLHPESETYSDNSRVLPHVFEAFEKLRFDHQYCFADYKLKNQTEKHLGEFLKWPPPMQSKLLNGATMFCFGAALLCSVALVVCNMVNASLLLQTYLSAAAISIALLGAALHTIQDGLALEQEIERYSDYESRTFQLCQRFGLETNSQAKLELMEEMELAAVDEMNGFLRTHHNARFVLA